MLWRAMNSLHYFGLFIIVTREARKAGDEELGAGISINKTGNQGTWRAEIQQQEYEKQLTN